MCVFVQECVIAEQLWLCGCMIAVWVCVGGGVEGVYVLKEGTVPGEPQVGSCRDEPLSL